MSQPAWDSKARLLFAVALLGQVSRIIFLLVGGVLAGEVVPAPPEFIDSRTRGGTSDRRAQVYRLT